MFLSRRTARPLPRTLPLAVAALAVAGCAAGSDASSATVIDVELGRYTIAPAVIEAPSGEIELRVTNVDVGLVHDLVVASKGTRPLAPGQSYTLPLGEVAAGEYPAWCDQPGHRQMGQTGVLRVLPPATP
jgi:uncharacterized cupredoxin-like copper-binding protein